MRLIFILCGLFIFNTTLWAQNSIEESIVKIYTVAKLPDYNTPWNSSVIRSHASGAIIEGERILTNAHVVANQTFVEVKKYGQTKRYEAKVAYISHQADLAILTLKDPSFFKGTKSLSFGKLPEIQQEVAVYGFPLGGESLSVSTGVVSRIEHTRYAHSRELFLAIQIDAAVNPGSSGGPAISGDKIVGVVMQMHSKSQNIGYIVPVEIVQHFLEDIKDKHYDGFAHIGITTASMENEALRSVYKMDKKSSGIAVIDIAEPSSAFSRLLKNDVILSIEGKKIENDGTIEFRHHQFTSYKYAIDSKQIGERVTMEVLRKGKRVFVEVPLTNIANDDLLVDTLEYDVMPHYFIYAGYVFSPLSRNLLMRTDGSILELRTAAMEWAKKEKTEAVVLLKVLASKISQGDQNFALWIVDKVNGRSFRDFKSFVSIIKDFRGDYLILENKEGLKVAIDRAKAMQIEPEILNRYSIKSSERL